MMTEPITNGASMGSATWGVIILPAVLFVVGLVGVAAQGAIRRWRGHVSQGE